MLDTTIQIKTDSFDGPLALLLLLIQKEEMNIKELNLNKITQQYLDYLKNMQELNFDVAGDYLYLAATLLLLKSKDCITEEETKRLKSETGGDDLGITSQAELVRRLEELHRFQKLGETLWELPKMGHDIFVKPKVNRKAIVNSILTPIDLAKLTEAMMDFLFKEKRKYTTVKRDRLSIKEKLVFLKNYLKVGQKSEFNELLEQGGEKDIDNIVITFISLLELARLQKISVFQNEETRNIYVEVIDSLENFDVNHADGFDEENEGEENQSEVTEEDISMAQSHDAPETIQ